MKACRSSTLCSVLVSSCGSYSDLWTPCAILHEKNWPDCRWPIYIGSDKYAQSPTRLLLAPEGAPWSRCLNAYLSQINTPRVLLLLDDFFLRSRVPTKSIEAALKFSIAGEVDCVRLVARPAPKTRASSDTVFTEIYPNEPYRISTQGAIWNVAFLQALLKLDESAWAFEQNAPSRTPADARIFGVHRDLLTYRHHVIERGMWFPWEAYYFGKMGIGCDFRSRRIMSPTQTVFWLIRKLLDKSGVTGVAKTVLRK